MNKLRWGVLARWGLARFKSNVQRKKRARCRMLLLCAARLRLGVEVRERIVDFL